MAMHHARASTYASGQRAEHPVHGSSALPRQSAARCSVERDAYRAVEGQQERIALGVHL